MKTKLLLMLLLANFTFYAQTNLVSNGDFENWTSSSQPDDWGRFFSGLIYKDSDHQNGNSSTKIEITSGTLNYMFTNAYFPVETGKTYRVTGYHKLVSGSITSLELGLIDSDVSQTPITSSIDNTSSNSEWRKIEFDYVATATKNIGVIIRVEGTATSEILIDNVSVVNIPQYTQIPDINFENKLISLGIDSGTVDGLVLTSDIASVETLDLYYSNISDLTGIEDFKSLTSLNCMSNTISSIDLSKNTALTYLDLSYNNLSALDLSANINLQTLNINYNSFTTIDLSKNTELMYFFCTSNQLGNVDFSHNTKLSALWCQSNQFTSLDFSNNTALTSLLCANNKLLTTVNLKNGNNGSISLNINEIDFTKNPLLTCIVVDNALYANQNWSAFKEATASYSTFDCSLVTPIPDLAFETKLIDLGIDTDGQNGTVLNSSISGVTALDVSASSIKDLTGISGFTALNSLNCSGNLLVTLNLSKNTSLTLLDCTNNTLEKLSIKNGNNLNLDLSSNFTSNPSLSCIEVDDVAYSNTNWTSLKDATANYNEDCTQYTLIPDSNFEDALIALEIDTDGKNGKVKTESVRKVTSLNVQSSNISDLTGIEDFTALIALECIDNTISSIDVSHNKHLTRLGLDFNNLSSLDVTANTELYNLSFSNNLVPAIDLSQNKKLHILVADQNLLTSIDFSENPELETIYCGRNNLTTLNVSNLPNLNQLNCILTNISEIDVTANPKLVWLYLNNNQLTEIDLSQNPLLRYLNLSHNQLTTLDLSHNPLLELIFVEFNPLTSLNVQNGNNRNFILPSQTGKKAGYGDTTSFLKNLNLSCIQVDDVDFSNTNWSHIKETTTSYSNTCKSLGIDKSEFSQAIVYPNPTKGEITINNIALDKATVYNYLGQLVKSFTLNNANTNNSIDLSGLPRGVYYVYLINGDAASAKKVIIE
ncbi:MAG: T9SS type A sorting domain-containing protein [Flavobacterium nitrogenifigens]|uniref:T9SS type A sorting domain-containing protein n=1 Tax=Flavobacterium nitrogenifigens TaxID=1617283 RepID=UPI002807AA3D|nr:T9SS type A sorting domain-containing protein [Flavobacterium nitrogenifigens]MDQ8011817.1 T9SS type A sorting domain-containing protein [Flavobacterium nitrogenifigens]